MKITMIGTGYVGLVSGACFAELGHEVICVDHDAGKIAGLLHGVMPIYEPGLDDLVARNVAMGRLTFSVDAASSVKGRDAVFIAVGTPSEPNSDRADLQYVFAAAKQIAANLDRFTVIVTKSTVPVGTNRMVGELAASVAPPSVDLAVASNPEFLREGAAINDFMAPDRVVIGADDPRAVATMQAIYQPLVARGAKVITCGLETAEIVKYAANAFLAVKISFMNEVSDLCEAVRADVETVAEGIGTDRRIGRAFLQVGPGWGGSCFPKDTRALLTIAQDSDVQLKVLEACVQSNRQRKASMASRVAKACGGDLNGRRVAVLGLTFKGQTDDMRESPSLDLVTDLCAQGALVHAFDPAQPREALRLLPSICFAATAEDAVRDADVLVVATDWQEFTSYDLSGLADLMSDPVLVDLRNLFSPSHAIACGFRHYLSLGREPGLADQSLHDLPQGRLGEREGPQDLAIAAAE